MPAMKVCLGDAHWSCKRWISSPADPVMACLRDVHWSCESAPKNYKLAVHIFGLLTTARSIAEFDDMLLSCTVIFSSPCSSENVEKHFNNIQALLTTVGESVVDDNSIVSEDLEDTFSQTPFHRHFMEVIGTAPLNKQGDPNLYYTETFISSLAAHFLSHAALWTSMMLGDLGRHGDGPPYQLFSKKFSKISKKKCKNFTQDNKTQGIMEKSQWDLKKIRFRGRRLNRLDDFIMTYKDSHTALLREFNDAERITKRKLLSGHRFPFSALPSGLGMNCILR
ncbi:hypothetical protein E1301_Tti019296 [Triplophysa tibetana]|uniref:Uncharacterized protein n=1 Tax=Triplophysa tibetana TaxID=1572043 RepID=A0A5A9PC55_9TELE|nr:hypothetical protein E1301_Tti019296 [Triplophysa tibetana]